ncbi:MAG: ester cyclase [Anaerolineaceae bacterium]|nr:ester cyclase [Anaerolineaceae bacterium]
MSNQSLLDRLFTAGDAGDLDAFDQYLHDDVVVHAPAELSTVGLDSERESWRKARSSMLDLHHQFIDVFSNPTAEAMRCVVTGTMRGSYGEFSSEGNSFRVDQAVFAHVRDGKITELWEIVDNGALRDQLGEAGR